MSKTDCIEYNGYRMPQGYGRRRYKGRMTLAHRVAWMESRGDIPDGLCVLHKCDNPPCINPDHLFLGTHNDNMYDMARKERHGNCKLTREQVAEIRKRYAEGGINQYQLADMYGVHQSKISDIVNYKARTI